MSRSATLLDHKKDDLVCYLILEITNRNSLQSIRKERLQEVFAFYLFFLAVFGIKDLMFFRDVVMNRYYDLDAALSSWTHFQFLRAWEGGRYELIATPRAINQFLSDNNLTAEEQDVAKKASAIMVPLYFGDIKFSQIVKETHYFL